MEIPLSIYTLSVHSVESKQTSLKGVYRFTVVWGGEKPRLRPRICQNYGVLETPSIKRDGKKYVYI